MSEDIFLLYAYMMPTREDIIDVLMTVFDPEFPLIDIWTMGLIYDIEISPSADHKSENPSDINQTDHIDDEDNIDNLTEEYDINYDGYIYIDMTFTTPACPAIDILPENIVNAIGRKYPTYKVIIETVRDPLRSIDMLKDEDLKRMFE